MSLKVIFGRVYFKEKTSTPDVLGNKMVLCTSMY